MGSAANFYTIISNLHEEFEGRVINKTRYLLEEILKTEKQLLLDQIQIIINRESSDQFSSFQWQLNERLLKYQCHSCSNAFSANANESNCHRMEIMEKNSTFNETQDFTDNPSFDDSKNDGESLTGESTLGDIKPQIDLQPQVAFDKIFKAAMTLEKNQITTDSTTAKSCSDRNLKFQGARHQKRVKKWKRDKLNSSDILPQAMVDDPGNRLNLKCPFGCTYTCSKFTKQIKHTQKYHTGEHLSCDKCNKGLNGDENYATHARLHNQTNSAKCHLCHKYEENPLDLEHHSCTSNLDPNGLHECQQCHKIYTSIKSLYHHKKNCFPPNYLFKCKYCPKKFQSERSCQYHEKKLCSLKDLSM